MSGELNEFLTDTCDVPVDLNIVQIKFKGQGHTGHCTNSTGARRGGYYPHWGLV